MGVLGDPFGTGTTSFNVSNLSPDFAKSLSKDLSGAGASWWQYLKNNDPASYEAQKNYELNRIANAAKTSGWNAGRGTFTDAGRNALSSDIKALQDMGFSPEDAKNYVSDAFSSAYQQYVSDQAKASQSSLSAALPSVLAVGSLFVPVAGAIGSALTQTAATTLASQVVGSAVVQGLLAESQGGNFADGAVKGAISAGVAPTVAQTVGSSVANLMQDSAIKNVVANAVGSAATGAVTAALTGGDVEQAAKTGALAGAGGATGRELGTAAELGTTPFSEQTQQLAAQTVGMGTPGDFGSVLGSQLAQGVDPAQAVVNALATAQGQKSAATGKEVKEPAAQQVTEAPVVVPGAENVAQLMSQPGVQVAGPFRVEIFLPKFAEDLPPDFKIPEGYRALSLSERMPVGDGLYAGSQTMREAGLDVRDYTDPNDPTLSTLLVPATTGRVRFEDGNLFIDPTLPLEPISGISPAGAEQAAGPAPGAIGGDVVSSSDVQVPAGLDTFTQEPVNILDLLAQQQAAAAPSPAPAPTTEVVAPAPAADVATAPAQAAEPIPTAAPSPTFEPTYDFAPQPVDILSLIAGQQPNAEPAVPGFEPVSAPISGEIPTEISVQPAPVDTTAAAGAGGALPPTQEIPIPEQIGQVYEPETVAGPGAPEPSLVGGEDAAPVETLPETVVTAPEVVPEEVPVEEEFPAEEVVAEEVPAEEVPVEEEVTTAERPTILERPYISGGRRPTMGPTVTTLGQALSPAFFPSGPVSGLTSYRGAGEIESSKTGKPRQNVWNEASLRLKDALGL